jgi:hypothetical protein
LREVFGPVGFAAATTGAVFGGVSHVLLDAIMHPDLQPFATWKAGNPLLSDGASVWLHLSCIATGMLGTLWWLSRYATRTDRSACES